MSPSGWSRRRRLAVGVAVVAIAGAGVWGVRLSRVLASVETHARYWEEPRGEAGGLVHVALGDSTVQGIGASSPEKGWVSLVAERLREATGLEVQVVNLSVSGAHVEDVVRDQLPQLDGLCADLITVAVGGNDILVLDDDTLAADITALVEGLPEGTVIADVPYFMHGRWEDEAASAAETLSRRAAAEGLIVADLHAAMRARGWSAMVTDYAADWFHPNDRGHRVWADAFWARIAPLAPTLRPSC